jgi:16S rRNA (uracil1498-N3)-methyltransferase
VNIVLFEPGEVGATLARGDVRTRHLVEVLRRGVGDRFDAGVVDGAIGVATISALDDAGLTFSFVPERVPPPLPDVTLIVGLPRPNTARDVLRDATTLGVSAIHFVATERTTPSYATSKLWTDGEVHAQLLLGAAQAFDTRVPVVTHTYSLAEALALCPPGVALDNYEAETHLGRWSAPGPVTIAIGPERGWGPKDRAALRAAGATLHHLGTRVLRVEMAVVAALTLVHARG